MPGDRDAIYVGWVLRADDRAALLARFPPAFPDVVADHVTLCRDDAPNASGLAERRGRVVGRVVDPAGVEVLVVEIDGTTDRPGGGTYHLTWSIDVRAGRKAFHSNAAIAELGWDAIDSPFDIALPVGAWPASRYS
jgi:hypothetical protein